MLSENIETILTPDRLSVEEALELFGTSMVFYRKKSVVDQIIRRGELSLLGCNATQKDGRPSRSCSIMPRFRPGQIVYVVAGKKPDYRIYGVGAVIGPVERNNRQIADKVWFNDEYWATNFMASIGIFPEGILIPKTLSKAIRYKKDGFTHQAYGPFNSTSYFVRDNQALELDTLIQSV